jgi:alpha-amylase/alpha-mannosidase (GH57 family)
MSVQRYICIHGHFYQPPREHAWLEAVEIQDSAYPYHDWNQRITAECYGPNAVSRVLNEDQQIVELVNNYAWMSFNFGPTLLVWLERNRPEVYASIIEADQQSVARWGRGSAMAQVYNHIIMPLANRRDKQTQVRWGLYDFQKRFGRRAEGMWLAETAVDTETLEVLAEEGVQFTVLASRQMAAWRRWESDEWAAAGDDRDALSLRPYLCRLPSGRSIKLFFYHGGISQRIAFDGLLQDGEAFAQALKDEALGGGSPQEPVLLHVATDGETYGHHHRNGDMALAWCLRKLNQDDEVTLINYATYLERHPPVYEAQIVEESSWSCAHGVARWKSDCGCATGAHPGWHQRWRAPLRRGFDDLRDQLMDEYQKQMLVFCADPWRVRDAYIQVILDRSEESVEAFLMEHLYFQVRDDRRTKVLRLLEMARHIQLMYTSCAWFFDEVTGIETRQVLQYACRALQIASVESPLRLDEGFSAALVAAESNDPAWGHAGALYVHMMETSRLSLTKVGMHEVARRLFTKDTQEGVFADAFRFVSECHEQFQTGGQLLAMGRTQVFSRLTHSLKRFSYAVIYLGQHHLIGNASDRMTESEFMQMYAAVRPSFENGNLADVLQKFQHYFGEEKFSFWQLFRDQQQQILRFILERELEEAERMLGWVDERNEALMAVIRQVNLPLPLILRKNMEAVVNHRLRRLLESEEPDEVEMRRLVQRVRQWHLPLELEVHRYLSAQRLPALLNRYAQDPTDPTQLVKLHVLLQQLDELGIDPDVWDTQNILYRLAREEYTRLKSEPQNNTGSGVDALWYFRLLSTRLKISLEEVT